MERQKNALLMPAEAEVSRLQSRLWFPHGVINPQFWASHEWADHRRTISVPSPSTGALPPPAAENRSPAQGQPVSVRYVRVCMYDSPMGLLKNRAHLYAKFAVQDNVDGCCVRGCVCLFQKCCCITF